VHASVNGDIATRFRYTAAVGPELRFKQDIAGNTQGSRFSYNVAAAALLGEERQIQVGPELMGAVGFQDVRKQTTNLELMLGARYRFLRDFVVGGGVGGGLISGLGTPVARGIVSFAWSPLAADSDKDGITDDKDACPRTPGPKDPNPDKNGCPPPEKCDPPPPKPLDTDGDGILDPEDACVTDPGPKSSDRNKHGCPDTDGDGILDKEDACKTVKGVPNADKAKHGCPIGDADGDGILDDVDACKTVKGIVSSDPKLNGCPPPDTDGDGFIDKDDACPKQAGPDHKDPTKRGCPIIALLDKDLAGVEFDTDKSTIRKTSDDDLDRAAALLKEHPELLKLEVQGHTDNVGNPVANKALSQARADAVKNALIKRGIAAGRLTAKGYGQDQPIDDNKTPEGRQKNRRVQFKILEQKK
jgi:outer membrane protein OmpA-like peptidoglycan-associated protein